MQVDRDAAPARRRRSEAVTEWARARRVDAGERLDRAERRYPAVRFVLTAAGHDRISGGPLLAGALAFRLFLWLLPACLVVVGLLGFATPGSAGEATSEMGLGGATASTIATATAQAHEGRWLLVVTGLFALFSASLTLARTLWVATILAWQLPVVKLRHPPRAAGLVVGFLVSTLGLVLAANWLRSISYAVGLVVSILLVMAYALLGWVVLAVLPRPGHVSLADLIPGALLVGVGAEGLHLVAAFYLARQLSQASELYGALGSAATVMLWCYLLARVLIGATAVNRAWVSVRESRGVAAWTEATTTQRLSPRTAFGLLRDAGRDAWREARGSLVGGDAASPEQPTRAAVVESVLERASGPATMTVWFLDDERGAERAARTLADLERRGLVTVLGAGLVSWPRGSPRPRTRQASATNLGGALGASFWGLVLGLVFLAPLTADGGAGAEAAPERDGSERDGEERALRGIGLGEDFVHDVRAGVRPGTSALLVLSAGAPGETVGTALTGTGPAGTGRVETRLTREQEARLREVFAT